MQERAEREEVALRAHLSIMRDDLSGALQAQQDYQRVLDRSQACVVQAERAEREEVALKAHLSIMRDNLSRALQQH